MTADCAREREVVQEVLAGRLDRSDELRLHAAGCEVCADAAFLAALLREDRDGGLGDVQVPAAGQVWWRAAVRARLDATQAAARPLTWAHGVAAASAAGVAAAVATTAWPSIVRAGGWLAERTGGITPDAVAATDLAAALLQRTIPFGLAAAFLLVAPIALDLALSEGRRP